MTTRNLALSRLTKGRARQEEGLYLTKQLDVEKVGILFFFFAQLSLKSSMMIKSVITNTNQKSKISA